MSRNYVCQTVVVMQTRLVTHQKRMKQDWENALVARRKIAGNRGDGVSPNARAQTNVTRTRKEHRNKMHPQCQHDSTALTKAKAPEDSHKKTAGSPWPGWPAGTESACKCRTFFFKQLQRDALQQQQLVCEIQREYSSRRVETDCCTDLQRVHEADGHEKRRPAGLHQTEDEQQARRRASLYQQSCEAPEPASGMVLRGKARRSAKDQQRTARGTGQSSSRNRIITGHQQREAECEANGLLWGAEEIDLIAPIHGKAPDDAARSVEQGRDAAQDAEEAVGVWKNISCDALVVAFSTNPTNTEQNVRENAKALQKADQYGFCRAGIVRIFTNQDLKHLSESNLA